MTTTFETLRYEVVDGLARLTLDRPDRLNGMTNQMVREAHDALVLAAGDPSIRVLVLTGEGRGFCPGADLGHFTEGGADERLTARQFQVTTLLHEIPAVTVAAVNGACAGAGLGWALACDLRVAAPGITLGLPEATIGMGANFGSVVLPKRIPMGIAMEMLLTGDYVTSEDAERWGLVNRLVARDDVLPTALDLAGRIAANAPISVRRMKETAVKGLELPLWQALRLDVGPNPYLSEDRTEGIAAYLEKRPPRWSGR